MCIWLLSFSPTNLKIVMLGHSFDKESSMCMVRSPSVCTYCSLCLECFSMNVQVADSLTSFHISKRELPEVIAM